MKDQSVDFRGLREHYEPSRTLFCKGREEGGFSEPTQRTSCVQNSGTNMEGRGKNSKVKS